MMTMIVLLAAFAATLQAQEFAVAKVTCVEPIGAPTILSLRVTGSVFEGSHELRLSPKQCPVGISAPGWQATQPWSNGLTQVEMDIEISLVATGDELVVKQVVSDLLVGVAQIQ
jgi:hypothetical protein